MSERFERRPTALSGVYEVRRKALGDNRGWFERLYCHSELLAIDPGLQILQINRSRTARRGTIRGMHLQVAPDAEMKLVSCLRGQAYDVAVDLRRGSPTLLQWHGVVLSEENRLSLYIPAGVAHGFQSLSDGCEMLYLHTANYAPTSERGADALDPRLAIAWPERITERSERDRAFAPLAADFAGFPT